MTEQEIIVAMARRLAAEHEAAGREIFVEYPTVGSPVLDIDTMDDSYGIRFVFDAAGNVIKLGGGP